MSNRTAQPKASTTLKRRDFFALVLNLTGDRLPAGTGELDSRLTMNLLKVHYGQNYRVHYEVWISRENGKVEVGLHFEDGPKSTEQLIDYFDAYILEIKDILGEQVELEQWTKSWGHLYELHDIEPLDPRFANRLADRLSSFILTLQPILEEAYELNLVSRTPRPSRFAGFRNRRS